MVELTSIEQLLYFMKGHIQLSRYDEKFIDTVTTLTTVTTNQVILLHTLIYKYRKQFSKHELFVEKLVELPWNATVIESSTQYTEAHVSIVGKKIIFKCPYNRNFIENFRRQKLNTFIWLKDKRHYESDYGQQALKLLIDSASKHFKNINFCPVILKLLEPLTHYQHVKYWQPTLVNSNGNLLIAATNEVVDAAISNHTLNTDLISLSNLASYGIQIDKSLYDFNDPKSNFFANFTSTVEIKNIVDSIHWIKELKCENVLISGMSFLSVHKDQLISELNKHSISFVDLNVAILTEKNKNKPFILLKFKSKIDIPHIKNMIKVVQFVNSEPIDIK
jgi:hypothetical protein